jgi:CubicO group peptidase (beta-lactamase class C family)
MGSSRPSGPRKGCGPRHGRLGSPRVYSNFGYQLLSLVISRASGRAYQDLIAERLLAPLEMRSSSIGAANGGARLTGHARGRAVRHWDHALPGPGAVETSIGDLARYLSACLVPPDGPLGAAIELCQVPRVQVDERRAGGLGWMIANSRLWHNGRTGGFAACVGLDRGAGHALGVPGQPRYSQTPCCTTSAARLNANLDHDPLTRGCRIGRPQTDGPGSDLTAIVAA